MARTIGLVCAGVFAVVWVAGCGISKAEFQEYQMKMTQQNAELRMDIARVSTDLGQTKAQLVNFAKDVQTVRTVMAKNLLSLRDIYRQQYSSIEDILRTLDPSLVTEASAAPAPGVSAPAKAEINPLPTP